MKRKDVPTLGGADKTERKRRKHMADWKRKLTALLLALIFVAGTLAISGCKGESAPQPKKTTHKQQLPEE
jgi:hypothetical protein